VGASINSRLQGSAELGNRLARGLRWPETARHADRLA
jgi:hypothetical protein